MAPIIRPCDRWRTSPDYRETPWGACARTNIVRLADDSVQRQPQQSDPLLGKAREPGVRHVGSDVDHRLSERVGPARRRNARGKRGRQARCVGPERRNSPGIAGGDLVHGLSHGTEIGHLRSRVGGWESRRCAAPHISRAPCPSPARSPLRRRPRIAPPGPPQPQWSAQVSRMARASVRRRTARRPTGQQFHNHWPRFFWLAVQSTNARPSTR